MYKIRTTPERLHYPIVLSEEFVAVHDDKERAAPIVTDKDILEFVQNSKNISLMQIPTMKIKSNMLLFPHHPKLGAS
ncbi:hypothetical protein TNCV_911051 [Trichonephila clavipes]|uniref:Uncharacterized protein n=1 Tax=Trichonephila clavipes TaxID=2585209 RepID=A0A8X6W3V6_TRICX|nr:hypothetical protein TNCV_911051 [Trichonephila clavipes]